MNTNKFSFGKNNENEMYAPVSLPKFSFDKVLEEKDEFRHQIKEELKEKIKKEERKPDKTKIIIAALTGIILLLFGKKAK
jgi:hypothetical protein